MCQKVTTKNIFKNIVSFAYLKYEQYTCTERNIFATTSTSAFFYLTYIIIVNKIDEKTEQGPLSRTQYTFIKKGNLES